MALALAMLMADYCAGLFSQLGCPVRGVVVIYIDRAFRQHAAEIRHDLCNGLRFIVAWNQNGNLIHTGPSFILCREMCTA